MASISVFASEAEMTPSTLARNFSTYTEAGAGFLAVPSISSMVWLIVRPS